MSTVTPTYTQLDTKHQLYNALIGKRLNNWEQLQRNYDDDDPTNDFYYSEDGGRTSTKINPRDVIASNERGVWGTYKGSRLDPNKIYTQNKLTPTALGTAFRLNSNTPPVSTPNNKAYSYNEWKNGQLGDLRPLANIYGDIDTANEFNIIRNLEGGQDAIDYINNNFVDASGNLKALFDSTGFRGTNEQLKAAASLLNEYLTSDQGKNLATKLRRGYASLDNIDKYEAYDAVKDWQDISGEGDAAMDKNYLNQALNSRDKMYRGAQFFRKYAGNKTWGNLANQFARNNRFRDDHYTVDEEHVMDRLNRDAGLGNGRKLIDIYNDIINNSPNIKDEQAYALFRDMTRRRFKMDNDFWNRHAPYLAGIRNKVIGADDVLFEKEGGQIFRMLFV